MTPYKVKVFFDIEFKTKPYLNAVEALNGALTSLDAVLMSHDKVFEDWELKNANVEIQEESSELGDERMGEEN